jgi:hypothetical protein
MKRRLFAAAVVLAALPVLSALVGFMLLVISLAPPMVSGVSLAVLAVAGLWFFLHRRAAAGVVSEASLMGRQSSTEGLL